MEYLNKSIRKAYKILDGEEISRELASELASIPNSSILDLVSLAGKVRDRFRKDLHVCTIMNAKSGRCSENCRFCAQSSHYETAVETYDLKDTDEMLRQAEATWKNGVKSFGLVTSGQGYKKVDEEFRTILNGIDLIKEKFPELSICASLGLLTEETVKPLAERGIKHYNINFQTSADRYKSLISTTHEQSDKLNTIKLLKQNGIMVCCGGIIGLGESMQDRVDLAFQLKETEVDVIPLNVLIPIPGTPMENLKPISAAEAAKTFALFRLINPGKTIKFAAGRETRMKDFMSLLMLAGVNGFLTGGYLTTRGRDVMEDKEFAKQLNLFQD